MHQAFRGFVVCTLLAAVGAAVLLADTDEYTEWIDALGNTDPTIRDGAVTALAERPHLLSSLITDLGQEHDALTKAGLALAIRRQALSGSDVTRVAGLLGDTDPAARHGAVSILVGYAASARAALLAVAQDDSELPQIRAGAALALAGGGTSARTGLLRLAGDTALPAAVRHAAIRALARVTATGADDVAAIASDADRDDADRAVAVEALRHPDAASGAALRSLAVSRDGWIREAAVSAIGSRGDASDASFLAGRATDIAPGVRLAALQGLAGLSALTTQRSSLLVRLNDPDPRVQAFAATCVGATCSDVHTTVIPTLKTLLASANFEVRHAASLALLALQDKSGLATMQADMRSPNQCQAARAAQAYTQILNASW